MFRLKKLDLLIIKSFIGPFIVTFFVALFVLVMQFFWLYMDELIGKGLGAWMILQLLFYMSATMVPLALPLGILLASIMTFGNMGENFELVAIKSAGISLLRFLRPLFLFIVGISLLAFIFNNNLIPVANLKALSLLYDLRNSKPTLNIRPGQFNRDIDGYSIRVGQKEPDGNTIRNILIYDHTSGRGNDNVVVAKEGEMIMAEGGQFLIFRLLDGWRYEEGTEGVKRTQTRMYFKQWDKVFDLSSFKLNRTDEDLFKGAHQMMNIQQLNLQIDSMGKSGKRLAANVGSYLGPYLSVLSESRENAKLRPRLDSSTAAPYTYDSSFLEVVPDTMKAQVMQLAMGHIRNSKGLLDISSTDKKIHKENLIKYNIEWHRKFTLSFACVLLFLIGAPLGAIIRKGGLGMPLVIAISFFIIFHIMTISGEKLAKSAALDTWMGMWMATGMLLPIAMILINASRKDSQVFSGDWFVRTGASIKNLFQKK